MDALRLIWHAEFSPEWFEAMWRIYVDSIPAAERKPEGMIRGMWGREDYRVGLAEAGKEIVGFSILFVGEMEQSKQVDFYLLEYFAIDAKHRGRGVGSELFRQTIDAAGKHDGIAPVLIEVESDRVGSEQQRVVCGKRIEFYRRLGCRRIVGLEYLLPLKWRVPGMELMVWMEGDSVSAAVLRGWLGTIYSKVYGRETNDPRVEQMLGAAGAGGVFRLEWNELAPIQN